jgi:threonine/homoserine/homoserine lactone efflux protein
MLVDLLPLVGFTFVSSVTPGPNNTLLMLSGAHWGFRKSLPLLLGIPVGFSLFLFAVGMGLGKAFAAWPALHMILKIVSVAYLSWLAWKLARAGSPNGPEFKDAKPVSFWGAVALQWINPKAWLMSVGSMSIFVPSGVPPLKPVLTVTGVFVVVALPALLLWFFFGAAASRFLTNSRRVTVFNVLMAVLLVLSVVPILF